MWLFFSSFSHLIRIMLCYYKPDVRHFQTDTDWESDEIKNSESTTHIRQNNRARVRSLTCTYSLIRQTQPAILQFAIYIKPCNNLYFGSLSEYCEHSRISPFSVVLLLSLYVHGPTSPDPTYIVYPSQLNGLAHFCSQQEKINIYILFLSVWWSQTSIKHYLLHIATYVSVCDRAKTLNGIKLHYVKWKRIYGKPSPNMKHAIKIIGLCVSS